MGAYAGAAVIVPPRSSAVLSDNAGTEIAPFPRFTRALRGPGREQNASPHQVEAGTSVALPFQQLKTVDRSFGLTAAPGFGYSGADRCPVHLQPGGERSDGNDATCPRLDQPDIQIGHWRGGLTPSCRPRRPKARTRAVIQRASVSAILVSVSYSTRLTTATAVVSSAATGWTSSHASCGAVGKGGSLPQPLAAPASSRSPTRRRPTLAGGVRRSASQWWTCLLPSANPMARNSRHNTMPFSHP